MDAYWLDWANLLLRWGARHHRHGVDRRLLLLRRPRFEPDAPGRRIGAGERHWRRALGGARRRLLSPPEVPGVAGEAARPAALVDVGKLLDLAHRLRAVHGALPVQRRQLPDRQGGVRLVARRRRREHGIGLLRRLLGRLRRHLPPVRRAQERRRDRRRAGRRLHRLRRLALVPPVRRPRRIPAGRRDDGDDHERERADGHHPRSAQGGRGAACRAGGRSGARPARQAAQRPQHLLHAARRLHDAEQPLRLRLRRELELAGAGGADARGRPDPRLVRAPPQGARQREAGAVAMGRSPARWS